MQRGQAYDYPDSASYRGYTTEDGHLLSEPYYESPRSGKRKPTQKELDSKKQAEDNEKKIKELEEKVQQLTKEKAEEEKKAAAYKSQIEKLERTREAYFEERVDKAKVTEESSKQKEVLTNIGLELTNLETPLVTQRLQSELKRRYTAISFDFKLLRYEKSKNFIQRIKRLFWAIVGFFTLMTMALGRTSVRFDRTINAYFYLNFLIINTNWVCLIILAYLVIVQVTAETAEGDNFFLSMSLTRYDKKHDVAYGITIIILAILMFFNYIYRFIVQSKINHKLTFEKQYNACNLVFADWSWNFSTRHQYNARYIIFQKRCKMMIEEIIIEQFPEDLKLTFGVFCIRVVTFLLTIGLLVASWAIIIFGPFNPTLLDKIQEMTGNRFVAELIVGIIFGVYNHAYPYLVAYVTYLEKWKLSKDRNHYFLWRFFLSRIVNLTLCVLNLSTIFYRPPNWDRYTFGRELSFEHHAEVRCPSDRFMFWLYAMCAGDFIFNIVWVPLPALFKKIWSMIRRIPYYKPSFKPEIASARLVTMQCWVWSIIPFHPFGAVIGLGGCVFLFLYEWFTANYIRTAPSNKYSLKSVLRANLMFYGVSVILFTAYTVLFLEWPFETTYRNNGELCGPFEDTANQPVEDLINSNSVTAFILDLLGLPPLLWFLLIVLLVNVIFLSNKTTLWREFYFSQRKKEDIKSKEMHKRYNLVENTLRSAKKHLTETAPE